MYKLVINSKGNRYLKDGKFVAEKDVPEVWKRILNKQDIFTGEPGTHQRMIANVMIPLSDDSYYSQTVGSITGVLNKGGFDNGTNETAPERSPS